MSDILEFRMVRQAWLVHEDWAVVHHGFLLLLGDAQMGIHFGIGPFDYVG